MMEVYPQLVVRDSHPWLLATDVMSSPPERTGHAIALTRHPLRIHQYPGSGNRDSTLVWSTIPVLLHVA